MNNHWAIPPAEIERRSFEIIDREAPDHNWSPTAWTLIRRLIHTSADFEYSASVRIHPEAISAGINAIRRGRSIITDTHMAKAGISCHRLSSFHNQVFCLIDQADVVQRAKDLGVTRALAAVDHALEDSSLDVGIWVIGNAPTALFRLL
ncbi:MAG: precorrin-8X methylmutase, partial [Deltaproteobacteria bacterium]|nr:precorrin-8X methylmutase [Deltaproteobacteria bacterium]